MADYQQVQLVQSDGTAPPQATVTTYPTGDNQAPPTGSGLLVSTTEQILNAAGNLDRQRGAQGVSFVTTGGQTATAVAAGTVANTVIKASAGRLCRVLTTSLAGGAATQIFDNATTNTGTVIAYIVSAAAAGTNLDLQVPAANGITVGGAATNPAMTITWI